MHEHLGPDASRPGAAGGLVFGRLVYDVDSNLTITVLSGSVFVYDLSADSWTKKDGMAPPDAQLWAYDPVTGHVFAADRSDPPALWEYDVETDTWTPIDQANGPTHEAVFAYDTSIDRMVAYTRGETAYAETWLFDIRTGTWTKSGAGTPSVMVPMHLTHLIDFDEAAERTVIMGRATWPPTTRPQTDGRSWSSIPSGASGRMAPCSSGERGTTR